MEYLVRGTTPMLGKRSLFAALWLIATGLGSSFAETRPIITLPGDRCPAYNKASLEVTIKSVMLDVTSDRSACEDGGRETLAALERMMQYGHNPSCFSDPYWYRGYQPWARDWEQMIRNQVRDRVKRACDNVRNAHPPPAPPPPPLPPPPPPPPPPQDQQLLQCNRLIDGAQQYYGKGSGADPATARKNWTNTELACYRYPDRMAIVKDMETYWAGQVEARKHADCRVAVEQALQVFGKDQTASPDQGVRAWTADRIMACRDMRELADTIRDMQDFWNDKLKIRTNIEQTPNPFGSVTFKKDSPFGTVAARDCVKVDYAPSDCQTGIAVSALNTCDRPVRVRLCLYGLDGATDCRGWHSMAVGGNYSEARCTAQPTYAYDAEYAN